MCLLVLFRQSSYTCSVKKTQTASIHTALIKRREEENAQFSVLHTYKSGFWKGHGKTDRISCKGAGRQKVLIHYGGGSVIRSGLLDRVKASLAAEHMDFVELGGAVPNPRLGLVYEGIELCKKRALISSWPLEAEAPSTPRRQSVMEQ